MYISINKDHLAIKKAKLVSNLQPYQKKKLVTRSLLLHAQQMYVTLFSTREIPECEAEKSFGGGGGGGVGRGRVLPEKLGGGVQPASQNPYFMTKICDIPYPISDLTKNSKPYL